MLNKQENPGTQEYFEMPQWLRKLLLLGTLLVTGCGSLVGSDTIAGAVASEAIRLVASVGPMGNKDGTFVFRTQVTAAQNATNKDFPITLRVNGSYDIPHSIPPGSLQQPLVAESILLPSDPSSHVANSLDLITPEGYCAPDSNPDPLVIEQTCFRSNN